MKIAYHQVTQTTHESFRVMELRGPAYQCTWHFHPEFQIGLVMEGAGHRIVGDNITPLEVGDLALLGPNLPHAWQFEAPAPGSGRELHAIIVYFREDSLGAEFFQRPEAAAICRLLQRASVGLSVKGRTRSAATALLKAMVAHTGFQRVLDLLELLHLLAGSEELETICSAGFLPNLPDQEGEKLRKICELIQQRLGEPLRRDEIARLAHFSPGAFSRFFRARTGKTFHDFVNELRIGRACRLLGEDELNITEVALACGFANLASFNRAFRRTKLANPTEYRRKVLELNGGKETDPLPARREPEQPVNVKLSTASPGGKVNGRSATRIKRRVLPGLLSVALALFGWPAGSRAQEVFREFTFNPGAPDSAQFTELDPGTKRQFSDKQKWAVNKPRHVPKPIVLDLAGATRAELSVEYWGGHIGTSGQRFNVNSNGWVDLPQPVGTPAEPQRFYRTLLGNNAVPIPLAHLRDGENVVQFAAGPQIAYGFDFGLFWIYDFTVRVFYGPERKAPAGEIVSPAPGAAFADTIEVEARAESPNGPVTRVEFIGEYDDFDWDGDGVWREWQFTTHHGALRHHLGTATQAPWRVTFDARWLPDQTQPVRVRVRITDATGMTTLTPPVEIVQRRVGRSVRKFPATLVPEKFSARNGVESPKCIVPVDADLVGATAARLVVSTWSGNVDDDSAHELRWNGERLAERFGVFHNYSHDLLELPVSRIKPGANEVTLFSTYKGHSLEVNWPGPVLLIEFRP